MKYTKLSILAVLALALGCTEEQQSSFSQHKAAFSSCAPTAETLGFENIDYWTPTSPTLLQSSVHEQGDHAIAYHGGGYVRIKSSRLCSMGAVGESLNYRLFVPNNQPNPWWWGQVQLLIDAPSLGIYEQFIAGVELTNQVQLGEFNTISFPLPQNVRNQLANGTYSDLQLQLVLNVPTNATGPYILDNITSGEYVDPDGEDDEPDTPVEDAVAGFEEPLNWEGEGVELSLDSENAAIGETALAVQVSDDAAWTSSPLETIPGISPLEDHFSFLVKLPTTTSADLAVFLEAPSIGLSKTMVASVQLGGYTANTYHAFSFPMTDSLISLLGSSTYDDLRIRFEMTGAPPGIYYFDELSMGHLNRRLYDHEAEGEDFVEPDAEGTPTARSISSTFRRSPSSKFPGKPKGPA